MPADNAFDLVAAKLEAMKEEYYRLLNASLFADGAGIVSKPLTRRERLGLLIGRVNRYFATLWQAVRGDDPYDYY